MYDFNSMMDFWSPVQFYSLVGVMDYVTVKKYSPPAHVHGESIHLGSIDVCVGHLVALTSEGQNVLSCALTSS